MAMNSSQSEYSLNPSMLMYGQKTTRRCATTKSQSNPLNGRTFNMSTQKKRETMNPLLRLKLLLAVRMLRDYGLSEKAIRRYVWFIKLGC